MSAQRKLRKRQAIESVVARQHGTRTTQIHLLTGQKKTMSSVQDIEDLPEVPTRPAQITTLGPDYGKFYWMADYDPPIEE